MGGRENSPFLCGLGTRPLLLRVEGFDPDHIKGGWFSMCVTIRLGGRDRNKPWESFTSVLETLKKKQFCLHAAVYICCASMLRMYAPVHFTVEGAWCLHVPPCRHSLQN